MRIAILDDNIADRRHAERLFKRESDRIHALGDPSFVIDCFGNTDKLYPMADTYDIFLIDMIEDPDRNGMDIARDLRTHGVIEPIILGISKIDYRSLSAPDDSNLFYLDKPYVTEPLIDMLHVCEKHIVKREGCIELRTDRETLRVSPGEILYGVETGRGYLTVATKNHPPVRIISDASSFYRMIQSIKKAPMIVPVSSRAFVNASAVKKFGHFSVTMPDGCRIRVASGFMSNVTQARNSTSDPA